MTISSRALRSQRGGDEGPGSPLVADCGTDVHKGADGPLLGGAAA